MALNLFVPLDVDYQDDPKIVNAGALAECLFVRSMALCKKLLNDGQIHRSQLTRLALGIPGPAKRHAQRLVDAGLWVETDYGWQLKAWLKRNQSAAIVTANSEARTAASLLANHERWHKEKPKIGCPHCSAIGIRSESDSESTEVEVEPQEEVEEEEDPSSSSVKLTLVANPPDDDDRIGQAIELHACHEATTRGKGNGYAQKIRTQDPIEHGPALRAYLDRHPDATDDELAHHVLGVPASEPLPHRRPPAPVYPPCDDCEGTGWLTVWAERDDGTEYSPGVQPCTCPQGQTMRTA